MVVRSSEGVSASSFSHSGASLHLYAGCFSTTSNLITKVLTAKSTTSARGPPPLHHPDPWLERDQLTGLTCGYSGISVV